VVVGFQNNSNKGGGWCLDVIILVTVEIVVHLWRMDNV